jgi:ZIP family zinc transporter
VSNSSAPPSINPWLAQLQARPLIGLGLGAGLIALLWLLLAGAREVFDSNNRQVLNYAMLGSLAAFAATAAGGLASLGLKRITPFAQDVMLGFSAGMMAAAASFSLLLPGLDAAQQIVENNIVASLTVVAGLALGVLLILGFDYFTPHEHENAGPCGPAHERLNRVWLFVFAIALHNVPEGMAIGVGFSGGDLGVGLPLTAAIALQDVPEGLVVALALRSAGLAPVRAALVAALSGAMEPLGALLGLGIAGGFAIAYPVSLGLAAGAMIFVVSHEIIPESHRNGHQTSASIGLMSGFAVMMFLDTALG